MRKHVQVLLGMTLLLLLSFGYVGADESQDLLLVTVSNDQGEILALNLYDPAADVSTPLRTDYQKNMATYSILLSADGRLAYSAHIEGRQELDVWDSNHPDQEFVAVMPVGEGDQYALAWSPDGHKLAHQSMTHDGHPLMYVWDGETSVDITPQDIPDNLDKYLDAAWSPDGRYLMFASYLGNAYGQIYVWDGKTVMAVTPPPAEDSYLYYDDLAWSSDGRLVFTLEDNVGLLTEVYVWDGHNTRSLSQNPNGKDVQPVWSADGRVAFQSQRDGVYSVLVWDGVSIKDGMPDASTFTTVAPEITFNLSLPAWTSTGQVAFVGQSWEDSNAQVYVWDGETATNISQNPTRINANPIWNPDGRWAFTNYMERDAYLYVRGTNNESLLMTRNSGAKPAWSSGGDLVFCRFDFDQLEYVLSVWNGDDVHEVVRGPTIRAQWQSGSGVFCSSG